MIFYGIITEVALKHRRFSYAEKLCIMHESALENSDHWDTTEKAITNGGTIIWDSLKIHKILSSASLRSYLEVIVFGNHVKIHQNFQFGLVCWF